MSTESWTCCDVCNSRDDVRYLGDTTVLLCGRCRSTPEEDL